MKDLALLWFTGIVSKYYVSENYDISKLEINSELLSKIKQKYDVMFIIYITNTQEEYAYTKLLWEHNLNDIKVVFVPYGISFTEALTGIISKVGDILVIDYSKKRLIEASKLLDETKLIHISQILI